MNLTLPFYLQNEPRVRGKLLLDFSFDPPPDLTIEVDIAHTSTGKLGLYAAMGVPEVWTYGWPPGAYLGAPG